jgi:hypothetical protein
MQIEERPSGDIMILDVTGKRIEDLLSITKLLTVFDAYESEQEALNSF